MIAPAPAGATCPGHPEVAAAWCCGRCGAFLCTACERRVRPDALPMCPGCWELRSRTVVAQPKSSGTALQTAAMVLGLIALLPLPAVQLAALILSILALVRSGEPPARAVRWRAVVGLCATLAGITLEILLFVVPHR